MSRQGLALPDKPSGYVQYDDYIAQQSSQGKRLHYTIVLPLPQIPAVLPVPDPVQPFEDNRQVKLGHAQAFADYVRQNETWHSGPLTVRTTSSAVKFETLDGGDYGTLKVGLLRVPRNSRDSFRIIDGQHRVLGIDLLLRQLNEEIADRANMLKQAERNGEPKALREEFQRKLRELQSTLDRVAEDSIGIDLVIEDDSELARQMFVDVANNALGINKAITARFDSRSVVNRALNLILSDPDMHSLIENRVDLQKDRIAGNNPNLLGAGHLADIVQTVAIGFGRKLTPDLEKQLDEQKIVNQTNRFLDTLVDGFPDLRAVAEGTKSPGVLRDRSFVVSTTMLRVLAGVYASLRDQGLDYDAIVSFFRKLARHVATPIDVNSSSGRLWIGATKSEAITDGATAPGARAQQVKELVSVISGWASDPPAEL